MYYTATPASERENKRSNLVIAVWEYVEIRHRCVAPP